MIALIAVIELEVKYFVSRLGKGLVCPQLAVDNYRTSTA